MDAMEDTKELAFGIASMDREHLGQVGLLNDPARELDPSSELGDEPPTEENSEATVCFQPKFFI